MRIQIVNIFYHKSRYEINCQPRLSIISFIWYIILFTKYLHTYTSDGVRRNILCDFQSTSADNYRTKHTNWGGQPREIGAVPDQNAVSDQGLHNLPLIQQFLDTILTNCEMKILKFYDNYAQEIRCLIIQGKNDCKPSMPRTPKCPYTNTIESDQTQQKKKSNVMHKQTQASW